MKKTILAVLVVIATTFATNAQYLSMKNTLKIGVMGGASLPQENAAGNLGLDLGYQYLVTPNFGLGLATGYNHFFGRDNDGIKNNDFGVVPVAALFRYYPSAEGFYLGTDLGYGFIVGDEKVAEKAIDNRPTGGLYLKPEIGYHNRNWNFFVHYTKVFTGDQGQISNQKYNAGSLGVGVAYNFGLGI